MNKNRDDILQEIDSKNHNLRETETKLKLTQNDMEILENKAKQLEAINRELNEKNEDLEKRLKSSKDQLQQSQREKDQIQIELNNKIEILQYKLINGGDSKSQGNPSQSLQTTESTFHELLQLCKGDLKDITSKLTQIANNEKVEEQLRKEIIDQGKKMNELRADHERQMLQVTQQNMQKTDQIEAKFEQEKKTVVAKLKEELELKNQKLVDLERQLQRDRAMREKAESVVRQMEDMKDIHKAITEDRDIVKQEKQILQKKIEHLQKELNLI